MEAGNTGAGNYTMVTLSEVFASYHAEEYLHQMDVDTNKNCGRKNEHSKLVRLLSLLYSRGYKIRGRGTPTSQKREHFRPPKER